jgi:fumarylpyruvate hydrolase
MTQLLFPLVQPTVPVAGSSQLFPVRRIYCVGRNYAAHALEMGADPAKEPPIFFMKPADAVTTADWRLPFPSDTQDLHHEVELVVALGQGGWDVALGDAHNLVYGYAVGIDLTKRDRQKEAKAAGAPWERAKAFDNCAPISPILPADQIGHPQSGAISLSVNGETRQSADLGDMIWPVNAIISRLSEIWTLAPGDLIFTGTPEGVGPLRRGDRAHAEIQGVGALSIELF